jgi:hypothetical protein|uniref:MSTP067 n=1 Tax=Homo sapiens TaxID=9606 RepID=Q7Z2T8_HUMAN|nr:MSTP067 [Homo sapiens]
MKNTHIQEAQQTRSTRNMKKIIRYIIMKSLKISGKEKNLKNSQTGGKEHITYGRTKIRMAGVIIASH